MKTAGWSADRSGKKPPQPSPDGGSSTRFAMTHIPAPTLKGKGMNINKYRGFCRDLIYACKDPELTSARKHVLLALVDYVNDQEGYTAWPAFNRLAEGLGIDRRTAIRAINVGRDPSHS
jgi:hypothetical protein